MATEMSLRVGRRIRQRREELGIRTQRELADLIPSPSVTNQTINKWEKGVNEPGPKYKTMLAEALDVDVAYFIAADPRPETPDPFPASGTIEERVERMERRLAGLIEKQNDLLQRQSVILGRIEGLLSGESGSLLPEVLELLRGQPQAAQSAPSAGRARRAAAKT